jgi:FADH2 O2-dependent halogenase
MIAKRLGRSVILLERGRHPRFAIGESSTPLANLLLEELATRYNLPRLLPLTQWGTWQRTHPEITCGLKRGFTFFHHVAGEPFRPRPDHGNQLLVAASPHDRIADTHWYRADFDQFLVREAQSLGVEYLDEVKIDSLHPIHATRQGKPLTIHARWLFDASGQDGYISKLLGVHREALKDFPATQSLFTHFMGVKDCAPLATGTTPYPPDAAAVHHCFDGGWIWSLRFNNGITSAGVMATPALATDLRLAEGAPSWSRLLNRFPTLHSLFAEAQPARPFTHAPSVAFRASQITGPGWTLLPSTAGFVDPLLSTGFPLTLLGIQRLALILEQSWSTDHFAARLEQYAQQTTEEHAASALLIRALYHALDYFHHFIPLTLLYFAAASYSEMSRRLGHPERATGFLLHNHPTFGAALRDCCEQIIKTPEPTVILRSSERFGSSAPIARSLGVPQDDKPGAVAGDFATAVRNAIAPIDVAGLTRLDRHNAYPVDAADTIAAAAKLGVDEEAIRAMFRRCEA